MTHASHVCPCLELSISRQPHPFFVIKESFLLRFRMDYTTINYV